MKNALVLLDCTLTDDILSTLRTMDEIKEDNETLGTCGIVGVNTDACDPLLESNTWKIHTWTSIRAIPTLATINGQN